MFDDIRPFHDEEIPAAMERIARDPLFAQVCGYLFPDLDGRSLADKLVLCRTVSEFQHQFMYPAIKSIISQTTGGVTVEGLDRLSPDQSYLFISNHRDIVLDAAILQVLLDEAGLPTSQISFGANLMQGQFIIDFGKANKMFRVERPDTVSSMREFLEKSIVLSKYIRYSITEANESLWIAQRNGRSKDGNDSTDRGLVTMLCQSGTDDLKQSLVDLHVVPVAISYEWEPCDLLKAAEMRRRASGEKYRKKPGEDLNSIITGILQDKGRMHFSVGTCIGEDDLSGISGQSKVEFTRKVAELIDGRIISSYRLYPNNFIAYDLLTGETSGNYTPQEKETFMEHLKKVSEQDHLLGIYANPVINRKKLSAL